MRLALKSHRYGDGIKLKIQREVTFDYNSIRHQALRDYVSSRWPSKNEFAQAQCYLSRNPSVLGDG